jgi:lambda repressor-like predicted transcriptional regulator
MKEEQNNIRNEVKAAIAMSGMTLTAVVEEMNNRHPEERTTTQNISNKLTRQTIKYSEVLEIADIIGMKIEWVKRND